jgi:hypothetical protein
MKILLSRIPKHRNPNDCLANTLAGWSKRGVMRAFIAILVFAVFTATYGQAQTASPSPAASVTPGKHHKKAAGAAMASPSVSPAPMASASPMPKMKKSGAMATNATPAPGGGKGQVWVNTDSHVYHKEGSKFYGKTKQGKYMSEQDAIKEGDKAAKGEH